MCQDFNFFFYNIIEFNLTRQKTNEKYFTKEITKKETSLKQSNISIMVLKINL